MGRVITFIKYQYWEKKWKAIATCHFQTLRFSAIVWYAIHLNFNFSSVFSEGPQGQISKFTGGPRTIVWWTLLYKSGILMHNLTILILISSLLYANLELKLNPLDWISLLRNYFIWMHSCLAPNRLLSSESGCCTAYTIFYNVLYWRILGLSFLEFWNCYIYCQNFMIF